MDKNTLLAFLFITLLLILYPRFFLFNKKNPPAIPTSNLRSQDSNKIEPSVPPPSGVMSTTTPLLNAGQANEMNEIPSHTIFVSTPLFEARFSSRGAVLTDWRLKKFTDSQHQPLSLFEKNDEGILAISVGDIPTLALPFKTEVDSLEIIDAPKTLVFYYAHPQGYAITKRFIFHPHAYLFDLEIEILPGAGQKSPKTITTYWHVGIHETEAHQNPAYKTTAGIILTGGELENIHGEKFLKENAPAKFYKEFQGITTWSGLRNKYFLGTLIFPPESDVLSQFYLAKDSVGQIHPEGLLNFKTTIDLPASPVHRTLRQSVYLGPIQLSSLTQQDYQLDKVMFTGYNWFLRADLWFPGLCKIVLKILNYLYGLIPNYGVAIILLTFLIKLITYPLTAKSTKSMSKMGELKPRLEKLKAKYETDPKLKNDPRNKQKFQMEQMKLMRDHGVNPLGGCLPMVVQMPIFISLFVTLRAAIELKSAPFLAWINDLSQPDILFYIPFKIPLYGDFVCLLPFLNGLTMYFTMTSQGSSVMRDPNQKMMMYFMPVFIFLISNQFPSGLVLYWTVSNILQIIQQILIKKKTAPLTA